MIVALRISTGGLGCRWYVEGYCGPMPPDVSGAAGFAALGAAVAGVGPPLVRAAPDAQPAAGMPARNEATDRRIFRFLLISPVQKRSAHPSARCARAAGAFAA